MKATSGLENADIYQKSAGARRLPA